MARLSTPFSTAVVDVADADVEKYLAQGWKRAEVESQESAKVDDNEEPKVPTRRPVRRS